MADTNIAFANIVPNTTPASWSQAYNAGKLFAVLSLEQVIPEGQVGFDLSVLGKEVISTFEQEFFTLENKNLDSIKNAISLAIEKITGPTYSFVITYISGSVLYVFIAGSGSVFLKRGSKLGAILESDSTEGQIKSGSGFLQNGDLVVLQTKNFSKLISVSSLAEALENENPSDISEILAPKVHEKQDGAASAAILLYKDDKVVESLSGVASDLLTEKETESASPSGAAVTNENFEEISLDNLTEPEGNEPTSSVPEVEQKPTEEKISEPLPSPPLSELVLNAEEEPEPQSYVSETSKRRFSVPKIGLGALSHRRRLLLTVAILILIVLGASIFLGIRNNNDKKTKEEFEAIYPKAQQKYDEGQSLLELNKELALEDFKEARDILSPNKDKFKDGSEEDKKIEELLTKVNSALGGESVGIPSSSGAKEVSSSSSDMLSIEINNASVKYFTQDEDSIYFIDGSGIQEIDKANDDKSLLVTKNWTTPAGIGVFGANLYVLDRGSEQIYKFAPQASGSAYVRSAYLSSEVIGLDKTVAMTIDGSIYTLSSSGEIQKFLRGTSTTFSVTGLSKKLSSPTRIQTDSDSDNLYILDNGNSRIVVLDKTGKFVEEYSASVIKNAKDFEVREADNLIYVLSSGKLYQINLK